MSRPTVQDVLTRFDAIRGRPYLIPVQPAGQKTNKGARGQLLETLFDIPQSSAHLDLADGEVKCFPILPPTTRKGVRPKETVAVTMLRPAEVAATPWATSGVASKMCRCVYVAYERGDVDATTGAFVPSADGKRGASVRYVGATLLCLDAGHPLYATLQADYEAIQAHLATHGTLSSSSRLGTFLQNRTKGAAGSSSRAFYLRTGFLATHVLPRCLAAPNVTPAAPAHPLPPG